RRIRARWERRSARQSKSGGRAASTRNCFIQEQALGQTARPVEEVVVENGIFIVKTCAGANDGLAAAGGIPGEARCWTNVMSRSTDAIAQPCAPQIQNVSITGSARCC